MVKTTLYGHSFNMYKFCSFILVRGPNSVEKLSKYVCILRNARAKIRTNPETTKEMGKKKDKPHEEACPFKIKRIK